MITYEAEYLKRRSCAYYVYFAYKKVIYMFTKFKLGITLFRILHVMTPERVICLLVRDTEGKIPKLKPASDLLVRHYEIMAPDFNWQGRKLQMIIVSTSISAL